jgi:hypothetical protein
MAKAPPSKEIVCINEQITVNRYTNGFMVEYSGQDAQGDYRTQKLVCDTNDRVLELLDGLFALPLVE